MKRKKGKVFLFRVSYTLFSMFLCYYLRFGMVLFLILFVGGNVLDLDGTEMAGQK